MIDAEKLQRVLPRLNDYDKDVDTWISDLAKTLELYDIVEPRKIFIWVLEATDEDVHGDLNSLKVKKGNEVKYPSLKQIQSCIEEYLNITENDKCSILKDLKISNNETIKKFNYRHKRLYHRLSRDRQQFVSVKDYINAIKTRMYPCSRVLEAECETLSEAYKVAEVAEETEREMNTVSFNENNYHSNNLMIAQNNRGLSIMNHPFYQGFLVGQSRRRGIQRYFNPNYNNYNTYGYKDNNNNSQYYNNYNNYYNNKNLNGNTYNNVNGINNNTNSKYNSQNFNNYRNYMENNNQSYGNNKRNIAAFTPGNNLMSITNLNGDNKNNNQIKEVNTSNFGNNLNKRLICFRCSQPGQKFMDCPNSFKQLEEMEEKASSSTSHLNQ